MSWVPISFVTCEDGFLHFNWSIEVYNFSLRVISPFTETETMFFTIFIKARRLPALTRPFGPDGRGTYSNRVGFHWISKRLLLNLNQDYHSKVCATLYLVFIKGKIWVPSVGSSGWYTALNSSISDQSGCTFNLKSAFSQYLLLR